jgi:glycosyltransferase involved in cell wall biosynthesis
MTVGGEGQTPAPTIAFKKPLLSICVTTYNRAAWLSHSLPLILEQTRPYPDLIEVIVVDNASTDGTPAVCRTFGDWPNVRVHRNEQNVGMLGNLAVSAAQAGGRYIWVIGDDDLMIEGALERVLSAIACHPDAELIYANYAYTLFDRPEDLLNPAEIIRGAALASDQIRDQYASAIREIGTKSNNCFTGIYCLIFREDRARGAYCHDTNGPPFSSLLTCVPTTHYIVEQMFDRPGYWIGDPCVVVNHNVSWTRYAAPYILERFPEIFERMEAQGAEPRLVDELRVSHLRHVVTWVRQVYFGSQREHLQAFSMERLVQRFGRLPEFDRHWPQLRAIYRRAFEGRRVEDPALAPERLDDIREAARTTGSPSAW